MIKIVCSRFEKITKDQVKKAKLARRAQAMVGSPPDSKFKQMVSNKSLKNCKVTVNDVTNADAIFGPNRDRLWGEY